MTGTSAKSEGALWTISEVSTRLDIPQHILRYWETRFPQLRPLQRAGNRRYYRPEDVALVERINLLLNQEGYTIKGVQKLLSARRRSTDAADAGTLRTEAAATAPSPAPALSAGPSPARSADTVETAPAALKTHMLTELRAIRDRLTRALADDLV